MEAPIGQCYANYSGGSPWEFWVGLPGNERLMERQIVESNILRN